jgi:hypothetical protein
MEKMMGSLYMFPRRLFWKRWQTKLSKLSQHFFFALVQELSDTPGIVFPRSNTYTELCVKHLHLPASTNPDTNHITSTAHSTCHQVRDRYEEIAVILWHSPLTQHKQNRNN